VRKELSFDTNLVGQEYYWDCGPASGQILLSIRHKFVDENTLIREIGTTTNGTDFVGLVERMLDNRLPEGNYTSVYLENDPISQRQKDQLWADVVRSIDGGFGVVANIVAPPGNHPRAVLGSQSPNYGNSTIWHYVTVIGYDTEARAVKLGDPGFAPFVYWITFDQLATLIPPKGYAFAAVGAPPAPAPRPGLDAQVLADAMGNSLGLNRYAQLLPGFIRGMQLAQITNVRRAAEWFAQLGHESGGLRWMEEIADGSAYEGRADLGNTQPGDGRKYKGHGPIQITGRHNHTAVSRWAFEQKYTDDPNLFVNRPELLGSDQYGFLGAAWYWTVARPNINAMCDAGDLNGVTRAINGGLNGIDERRARYDRALAFGDRLLPVTANLIEEEAQVASAWIGARKAAPGADGETRIVKDGREIGRFVEYEHGHIYWKTGADKAFAVPHDGLFEAWAARGWEQGVCGFPVRRHTVFPWGANQEFEGGVLFVVTGKGAYLVGGRIGEAYKAQGWETGDLGLPTSDERPAGDGIVQDFAGGSMYWPSSPTGVLTLKKEN
jgi:predicted chitinase